MKKIPSFTIDHIHLLRGIYVSRKDYLGDHVVTTFDIRMKEPNREPAIGYGALHTIEHLAATFLRNHPVWGDKIVFWGPMGCCTGNYFLMQGDLESKDIVELMRETFRFIRDFDDEVPGAAPRDCGNYLLHDLPMARWEADKYLREVLDVIEEKNLVYPTIDSGEIVDLTPSPCGHSPYLICDEQRERIKSVACYNPTSFLSKHSNLLPCRVPWYYGELH